MDSGRRVPPDVVARHNTPESCWVVIHGVVYDVTEFASQHPGGVAALTKRAGGDASDAFDRIGHSGRATALMEGLAVGILDTKHVAAPLRIDAGGATASGGRDDSYAISWHAERRAAILRDHPEVASLRGNNEWTVFIGLATVVLHAYLCLVVQRSAWWSVLVLSWTLGALCKMYQFSVCHDVCHGCASWWCRPDVSPFARDIMLHLLTLPCFTGETHQYFAYQHIGHHSALGKWPLSQSSNNDPPSRLEAGETAAGSSRSTPAKTALDADGDVSEAQTLLVRPPASENAEQGVVEAAPPLPTDLDGDLPATSSILLLFGPSVYRSVPMYRQWYWKAALVPLYQIAHMFMLTFIQFSVMLVANPVVGLIAAGHWLWTGDSTPLHLITSCMERVGLDRQRTLRALFRASPEWRQAARVWARAALGVGLQAWLVLVVNLWLVLGPFSGADGAGGWSVWSAFKGTMYLLLSELFLHGFAFHPYFGYFLGVHRSQGEGFATPASRVAPCQPTMSVYNRWTALVSLNLNYHVEHHDFPTVPWDRLPDVRRLAPEYYDSLEHSPGFTENVMRWVQHGHTWHYACFDSDNVV